MNIEGLKFEVVGRSIGITSEHIELAAKFYLSETFSPNLSFRIDAFVISKDTWWIVDAA